LLLKKGFSLAYLMYGIGLVINAMLSHYWDSSNNGAVCGNILIFKDHEIHRTYLERRKHSRNQI
jgi:hypothetical protein